MFSNITGIVGRKNSSDRHNLPRGEHHRQPSSSSSTPTSSNYDKLRHPYHIPAAPQIEPIDLTIDSSVPLLSKMSRQDSATAHPWQAQAAMQRPSAQLPEELRAREKQKQIEREREREREKERLRERQSIRSSGGSQQTQEQSAEPNKYSSNHMESSVTRLLVATKMLLESLTKWSIGQRTEAQVSDIYVRLGNDFNSARVAFGSYGIDMSNLSSVPDDLRSCLERCLSEDASPAVLEVHLPRIREIIINLLQGLKMKQAEYKVILVQQRALKDAGGDSIGPSSSSASRKTKIEGPRPEKVNTGEAVSPSDHSSFPDAVDADLGIRAEKLQRASSSGSAAPHDRARGNMLGGSEFAETGVVPGRQESLTRPPSRLNRAPSDLIHHPQLPLPAAAQTYEPAQGTSRRATPGSSSSSPYKQNVTLPGVNHASEPVPHAPADLPRHSLVDPGAPKRGASPSDEEEIEDLSDAVEKTRDKLNGVATSRSSFRTSRQTFRPSVDNPGSVDSDPSLKALKSRDALERRASKRFSAYTFNKMGVGQSFSQVFSPAALGMSSLASATIPNSPLLDRRGPDKRSSVKRTARPPPLPETVLSPQISQSSTVPRTGEHHQSQAATSSVRTKSSGGDKFESIEQLRSPTIAQVPPNTARQRQSGLLFPGHPTRIISQAMSSTESLPYVDAPLGPPSELGDPTEAQTMPPLPTAEEKVRLDAAQGRLLHQKSTLSSRSEFLNVYVQLGRQTRKATLELDESNALTRGITIARLRMLFVDRFSYSPGMEDFPTIYIKDPVSGVSYELENLDDVQEGCLFTLNIEPLDQVKQHLDLTLGVITRELRELKSAVAERGERELRRISHNFTPNETVMSVVNPSPSKITESQFQAAGQRVAQLKRDQTRMANEAGTGRLGSDPSVLISPDALSTASSSTPGSATAVRVAHELKVQFDELQSLRREFAIMRQLQGDFDGELKSTISSIRVGVTKVREIASTKVPAERSFIIAGKAKLDSSSQEVLTLVEDLQDTVDDLKLDVIQRGVKPKPALVKQITDDIEKATKGLVELEKYVQTVKPSWKKTWESELQNIVDEQEFLNHQEGLIADLRDDHRALQEVYANIQQVVKLRGSKNGGKYIPPLPEEGHEGLSTVMLEVKSQAVNHEKRLRALQAAERQRQKDIAARSDDFADELAGFVDGKVLRRTGGHLEAERVRQKRDMATFRAMFGGGGPGGVPALPSSLERPKKLILGKTSDNAAATGTPLSRSSSTLPKSSSDEVIKEKSSSSNSLSTTSTAGGENNEERDSLNNKDISTLASVEQVD